MLDNEINHNLIIDNKKIKNKKYIEYRNEWENVVKKHKVNDFPINLDLETITACNLKCPFCSQKDNKTIIKLDDYYIDKIIEEIKDNIYACKLQYRNEPLCDSRVFDIIKRLKKVNVLEVMFNTNGILLNKINVDKLIDSGIDKIIISVDTLDSKMYKKMRKGGDLYILLKNLEYLFKKNNNQITIRIQAVIKDQSIFSISEYKEYFQNKVDQIAFNRYLNFDDHTELKEEFEFCCGQLWQRLFILADGDIIPCCRAMKGFDEKLKILGNIKSNSIQEIWKSSKLKVLRELHKNNESHKIYMCRICQIRRMYYEDNING
jgi:MoaA/NifB/PqqE/SkfB family radical SAM enzyme